LTELHFWATLTSNGSPYAVGLLSVCNGWMDGLVREPSAIQLAMCAQKVWGLDRVAGGRGTWEWVFLSSGIMGCTRGRHSKCPKYWL